MINSITILILVNAIYYYKMYIKEFNRVGEEGFGKIIKVLLKW